MSAPAPSRVGYMCAYAPLPLFHAAGLVPYRILPVGAAPDRAGSLLHDNLCPHVKRVLDRALADDLPALAGTVFVHSCDAMRRLADAWRSARPGDRVAQIDLPVTVQAGGIDYLAGQLSRLGLELAAWSGHRINEEDVLAGAQRHAELARGLQELGERAAKGDLAGGRGALQALRNRSVTEPVETVLAAVQRAALQPGQGAREGVAVYLFGNVLPLPEAYDLFETCGVRIVADDLCTGDRQLVPVELTGDGDIWTRLARATLARPPCARTFVAGSPGQLGAQVAAAALGVGARGVIAHVAKFCDPYLIRLPLVREALREAGLPLLVLEGDCSLRSLGQQRTRLEAFVEMLGGSAP